MTDPHASAAPAAAGHDDHGHGETALGPIDFSMWGVGVLGVALGLLVSLCCAFATGML